jgi:hypothetical protein
MQEGIYNQCTTYLSSDLLMNIDCHYYQDMSAIKCGVTSELDEEFEVILAYWASNPTVRLVFSSMKFVVF